jgi:filamentous hemagglutinin family protein
MKSHASINRIYRLVWNAALGLWVAVAETAKGRSRGGSGRSGVEVTSVAHREGLVFVLHARCRAAVVMLLALSVFNLQVHAADAQNSTVVVGSGNVSTSGATTTINQASQRLAIDWTHLSTAANEALVFHQPNAQAIALNRITGSSPSEFLGSLTANGQVFILNPNGVLFGAGSQVNVGGLVASTLSMSNADFMAGSTTFGADPTHTGTGSSAGKVVNKGTLTAATGGYVALLAPEVRNEGVIRALLGTALLAAGNKITLNLDNGNLLGYSIDQGAINALAENKLLIQADGGQVLLSAKAMDQLTTATVNNTGVIEAKTIQNKAGRILLMGDMETGTVNVGGTLDASAPDGGNGGFIETSAANVNVAAGTRVTTKATDGQSGTWLIDPVDFTIAAGNAAQTISGMGAGTLSAALDLGNVSIATDGSTGGNGDINVNSTVSWASPSTLTLTAHRDINFNANVAYSGGAAGGLTAQATRNITGVGTLNLGIGGGTLDMTAGTDISIAQVFAGSVKLKATNGELVVDSGTDWQGSSFDLFAGTNIRGSAGAVNATVSGGGNVTASSGNAGNGKIRLNTYGAISTLNLTALGTGGGGQVDFASNSAVANASITAAQDVNASATGSLNLNALTLTGANQNVSLAASGGTLTTLGALNTGAGNLTLSGGSISLGGDLGAKDLSLSATSGLNINRNLTATRNLTLVANTGVQQTAGVLTVNGTTTVNAGVGQVSLTGANNFTGAVSVTNSGANNVAINNASGALTLGTLSVGSGTLSLTGNNITQTGAITQAAGAGAVTINGGASAIDLSNVSNNFTGAVGLNNSGNNAVTIRDTNDLVLGPSTVGGSLTATSGTGSISQAGALNVAGASTFTLNGTSKDVLLGTSANTFGGGVTVNGSGSVKDMAFRYATGFAFPTAPSYSGTLTMIRDVGAINLGTQTFSGGLALTAAGGINLFGGTLQTGGAQTFNSAVTVAGTVSLVSTAGGITFANTVDGANALSTTSAGATNFNASVGATTALTSLNVNSGGAINVQTGATLRTGDLMMKAVGGIGNGIGGAAAIDAARLSAINSGSGHIALSHTGTGTLVVADLGQGDGIQNSASGANVSLAAANGSIQVLGSTVSAAGGNVVLSVAGASTTHSVEIVNNGATQSNVTTTGTGNITINGNLTSGGASATGGSAGGVVVTNSNITAGSGTITISGDAGWPSGLAQVSRGVRLDSGAKVTGAGNINITGRVGSSSSATSKGLQLAGGAEVSSTGGDIALTGTLNNPSILAGTGLHVSGKVQSGASKKITLTGSATVGGSAGTGVVIDGAAQLLAGTGGLTVVGTVSSSTTATAIIGTSIGGGAISSTGAIDITGVVSAPSAANATALLMNGGTINSNGANIVLRGSGVPAPAPASSYGVNLQGTVTSGGGEIQILADRVNIANVVNAGTGRVVIAPFTASRAMTLGGSSEANALNLSASEINQITAGVLQIGSLTSSGGIDIGNNGGAITAAPGPLPVISLLNTGSISQTGAISVGKLNAVGSSVTLTNAGNQIDEISGRSTTGAFTVTSSKAAPLTVGTVDGYAGINSGSNATTLTNLGGAIAQTQAIVASSFAGSSNGGTTLGLASNQIGAFNVANTGSGNIVLANGIATTLTSITNAGGGRIDVDNTGNVTVASISSDGTATGTTAGTAAISVKSSQGILASGGGTHIANTGAGSLYLEGASNVGASSGAPLRTSATLVSAQATGAGAQVNLVLTNGGTLENVAANGSANVAATAGSLAVKTVSGSAVTLAANAGAITDANGAANNITGASLTASSQNGITLGTNVSGAQALSTTGAAGDITITAANAIDTSNFSVSTNAGSAQTVSLASNAGITVGSAFGNSQDKLKLIATGGNIAINGALTASELTLSTGGTSTQSAAITATGLELLGSGTHTLNHASNAVTTLAGNTGNVDYSQAGALAIGTVNTAGLTTSGKVLVRATGAAGDVTLNNTVTSGSAANDSLVLAAGRNFINNAGATPLNPGAGRFLVYSTDPTANTMGGFASTGNAFSRTYAANAPTDASMTSLSGNRMVYSVTPVLTITGDNQAKVYGAADPGLTYTLNSGLVAGDTAATALAGLLAAPTGSAASAGTHAITQGTLASALGYGIAYTNGTLTVGKATVSVTGVVANNKTYDSNATATLGNIGTLTGLAYGELLTLNSTGASFSDANAANGKTVTATYGLANGVGGLASNYQLAAAPVTTTADIAKANLGVTANNDSRTVGGTAYTGGNGVSFSGFVGGETAAVLGGALTYGGSSQGASAVGSYAIAASGYSAGNYTLNYIDGLLAINPVAVVPTVPVVQGGGALPVNDAYASAMRNLASLLDASQGGGGLAGGGADPSDALKAAAAEAGKTGESGEEE